MILVAAPDSTVDATDRALWLTLPFSLAWMVLTTPACRIFTVDAEDRVWLVPADDRVWLVPADDRVLTVECSSYGD